ncbi:hypothetical protein Tsubulata_038358 [Turnera subulata]|uniref:Lecithin-cholesterol acyltransferase-like 4 n=1 Tax=Turnera subulata TaxID=218843 RepID=A0A9Q0FBU3_9ROSI|nr:hypothetical protein Tsubulata_038358 [Turnera subulata]
MAVLLDDIVQSIELWLKLIRKPQPYVDPNLDPVLLVPGIAGSILKAVDNENGLKEERVWVRILAADYKFRTKLWSRFDPSTGRTESLDRKTSIMVPQDRYGLHAIDVLDPDLIIGRDCVYYFHDMIVEMIKWGFQEGKTLFGFGYDFRQSNRLQETMERLAKTLESIYEASGGKRINIISHSMGGILVKCFMSLHSDIFEKCTWIYRIHLSERNVVRRRLIECPSIYELMACPNFQWQHNPVLEIWREKKDSDGNSQIVLEAYPPEESVNYEGVDIPLPFNLEILKWADETHKILSCAKVPPTVKFYNIYATNLETPHSVCYGNSEVPIKDLQELRYCLADGLNAEARVGIPGEHRGILSDHHLFRILKHWLKAGTPDPYYDPINDYVILPTTFEIESHKEKGLQYTSLKEEWEIVTGDEPCPDNKPFVSSISISQAGDDQSSRAEACATVTLHPQNEGKQHVELNAISVSVDA